MSLDITLDRRSPVPLYYQLSQQIQQAIESGELKPGDQIDTEMEFAERLGLSRPTVRQAIAELVHKGLLVRRRGVGTQVVHAQIRRPVELTSLFDDLAAAHRHPSTEVIVAEERPADAQVIEYLGLAEGSDVLYLERLRLDDGQPLALMRNWLPLDVLSATGEELQADGLYALMRRSGVQMRVAEQRIGARAASTAEGRLLDVKAGSPLLTMERRTYDESGRAVEFARHAYRADAYTLETTLMVR